MVFDHVNSGPGLLQKHPSNPLKSGGGRPGGFDGTKGAFTFQNGLTKRCWKLCYRSVEDYSDASGTDRAQLQPAPERWRTKGEKGGVGAKLKNRTPQV